jgi:hypothetical protein
MGVSFPRDFCIIAFSLNLPEFLKHIFLPFWHIQMPSLVGRHSGYHEKPQRPQCYKQEWPVLEKAKGMKKMIKSNCFFLLNDNYPSQLNLLLF